VLLIEVRDERAILRVADTCVNEDAKISVREVAGRRPDRERLELADPRACEEQTRETCVALGPWSEDLGHLVAALRDQDGAAAYVPGVEVVDG
jgi:hypothetical protein